MEQALAHRHGDLISLLVPQNERMDSMEEHRKALGRRVAALREAMGLNQPQLAADAGISQPSLWAIEKGETKEVTARTLFRLAGALHTTIEHLWQGGEGSEEVAKQEAELVSIFRQLGEYGRVAVLQSARTVLAATPPGPQRVRLGFIKRNEEPDIGDELPETNLTPGKFPQKRSGKRHG